jgi:RNA-directed DNA polymerase
VAVVVKQLTEDWATLPWKECERNVYRLQKRIYQATRRGELKRVHDLQRLLLHSWSARCLAVRKVTQENRGKNTPGVDGVASLTPEHRLSLAKMLKRHTDWTVKAIRRVYIPKPGRKEKRGLGIPVMFDRAMQALVKLALEPEWEARFEPNSYGFRPGRAAHDAIEAIFNHIRFKPKYVVDADIAKCFDRISHSALLKKLKAIQPVTRLVHDWLKAGILEDGGFHIPQAGAPQGSVISPLLANIALHGFEQVITQAAPRRHPAAVIRYADDFVILCDDLKVLLNLKDQAETWLAQMGLELKPSKTRITHTLDAHQGNLGFDFLGFNIRQYHVGKHRTSTFRGKPGFKTLIKPSKDAQKRHLKRIKEIIYQYRGAPQAGLISALNPVIRGWSRYFRASVAKDIFDRLDKQMYDKLQQWAKWRHPDKGYQWRYRRYWHRRGNRLAFADGPSALVLHRDTAIIRHIKVKGVKSPFDGDWIYWSTRLGRDPTKPRRVVRLLKKQRGCCFRCGLCFVDSAVMEVHHKDGIHNNNAFSNLALLHAHCHHQVHGNRCL